MLKSVIVSVFDKTGLGELIEGLRGINPGVKIFSSKGSARKIQELGYESTKVSFYTGFSESPRGLLKTLHPKVHGGILLDRSRVSERKYLEDNEIETFNLVISNFYPFERTLNGKMAEEEMVEKIDIGGPTLARSAAKGALRHGEVAPVVDPDDYGKVVREMTKNNGEVGDYMLTFLAHKAFTCTYEYEEKIKNWTRELLRKI